MGLLRGYPFLIKENTNNLFQYYKDIPTLSSPNFDEIKCGQAKVLTIEEEKFGAYRDEHNKLHIVSAICPHMKCLVNWNNAEKTWDCPCHGSRFNYKGKVLEGPAKHDLKPKDVVC